MVLSSITIKSYIIIYTGIITAKSRLYIKISHIQITYDVTIYF